MSTSPIKPVVSSSISGYLHLANQTLVIVFSSGSMYGYKDVPVSVVEEFARAPSKGKFHFAQIKGNYDYRQLDQAELDTLLQDVGVMISANGTSSRRILEPHEIAALMERFPVLRMMF